LKEINSPSITAKRIEYLKLEDNKTFQSYTFQSLENIKTLNNA
jgi:hypothetical protein